MDLRKRKEDVCVPVMIFPRIFHLSLKKVMFNSVLSESSVLTVSLIARTISLPKLTPCLWFYNCYIAFPNFLFKVIDSELSILCSQRKIFDSLVCHFQPVSQWTSYRITSLKIKCIDS